ncbi:MAG TPA: hypothetical protein VEN81_07020, partial [Planctomycetota bacterium]|nr:hypothetical protein [Planctomycetota bacterium]
MRRRALFLGGAGIALGLLARASGQEAPTEVDFVRRIQPILADHCHKCHGLDRPKGGLRLDLRSA